MAAEPTALEARRARLSERAPSGGWRTIAAKEIGDHVDSVRFIVLLLIVGIAAAVPLYFAADLLRSLAPEASGRPALFLALFYLPIEELGGLSTQFFVTLLAPLLGIAFGFDAINSERAQGTLPRLLSQPIHRDDVINGKFAAGLFVIGFMLAALVLLIVGFGIIRLGIVPDVEEILRMVAWVLVTIVYVGFWLAFAMLLSVVVRRAASAALVGFGIWFVLVMLGGLIFGLLANAFFSLANLSLDEQIATNARADLFLRLSPHQLYVDATTVLLRPDVTNVIAPSTLGGLLSQEEQIGSLLTVGQSVLIVWPQVVALVALTVATFAAAYVLFLRQEVRA